MSLVVLHPCVLETVWDLEIMWIRTIIRKIVVVSAEIHMNTSF